MITNIVVWCSSKPPPEESSCFNSQISLFCIRLPRSRSRLDLLASLHAQATYSLIFDLLTPLHWGVKKTEILRYSWTCEVAFIKCYAASHFSYFLKTFSCSLSNSLPLTVWVILPNTTTTAGFSMRAFRLLFMVVQQQRYHNSQTLISRAQTRPQIGLQDNI